MSDQFDGFYGVDDEDEDGPQSQEKPVTGQPGMYPESAQLRSFPRPSEPLREAGDTRYLPDKKTRHMLKETPGKITLEELKEIMPRKRKHLATESLVKELNGLIADPEIRYQFKENLLGYSNILREPRITVTNYVHAVKYVSFKMLGYTNQESWIRTFPKRYEKLMKKGMSADYVRSLVSQYNRGKVVNQIMEQSLVPTWVLNQDVFQQAINTQAELMMTAKSEKVRSDAANSLLTHLKQPETTKVSLDVQVKEDDSIKELREATLDLVNKQRAAISAKVIDADAAARQKIITHMDDRDG